MIPDIDRVPDIDDSGPRSKRVRHGWALELIVMVVIYRLYDFGRELATGSTAAAFRNARDLVSVERFLGIYWERPVQQAFLSTDWFIAFWNVFYGTVHFILPVVALVVMYRKAPARYVRWRNTLVLMFAIAVLTFFVYPLMPPRLMPARYGFVDTAAEYFNFGPQVKTELGRDGQPTPAAIAQYGNPFAAMPSFHVGWSTWSVLALLPFVKRRFIRWALILYPVTIIFCITVTANHWLLDAPGGWAVLGLAYAGARGIEAIGLSRGRAPAAAA